MHFRLGGSDQSTSAYCSCSSTTNRLIELKNLKWCIVHLFRLQFRAIYLYGICWAIHQGKMEMKPNRMLTSNNYDVQRIYLSNRSLLGNLHCTGAGTLVTLEPEF